MISGTIRNRAYFYWGRCYMRRLDRKFALDWGLRDNPREGELFYSNSLEIAWSWPRIRAEWIMPGIISSTNEFSAYGWTGRRRELRFVPPVVRVSLIIGDRRWI